MSSSAVSNISKPQLRGLLRTSLRFHLLTAGALAIVGAVAYKYTICEPRKKKYAEFYKNHDDQKAFEAMKAAGVFQSVQPDD